MPDELQKEVDDYTKELDGKLKRKKITEREWDQYMANFECELNGSDPMYPWLA